MWLEDSMMGTRGRWARDSDQPISRALNKTFPEGFCCLSEQTYASSPNHNNRIRTSSHSQKIRRVSRKVEHDNNNLPASPRIHHSQCKKQESDPVLRSL